MHYFVSLTNHNEVAENVYLNGVPVAEHLDVRSIFVWYEGDVWEFRLPF